MPAFWHLGDHFGTSGAPWESVRAAGRTCGGLESRFDGFWDDLGTPFGKFFWIPRVIFFVLFRARFQVTFCTNLRIEIGMPGALETRFSIGRYCKNQLFTGIQFW